MRSVIAGKCEPTVAEAFRVGIAEYQRSFGELPNEHWKVINSLQACRTASLGAHVYRCEECRYEKQVYNSCRNRHCPQCQGLARAKWVESRLAELLPVDYFHVVFTVPSELNPFALRNKPIFYDLLQKAVAATLLELSRDPKMLGAEIGFLSVLHTWGQNLMDHPHVHCVVPGGALRGSEQWIPCKKGFLFPIRVMRRLFKGKFLDSFRKAVAKGEIRFLGELKPFVERSIWDAYLDRLYRKEWVVYCKPPFSSAKQVLKYLGSYTHRIAISNHRILSVDKNSVSFKWRSRAEDNRIKTMTLSTTEFIRRFLLHVLPTGFQRIRYYGFMANCKRKKALALCFKLLQVRPKPALRLSSDCILGLLKSLLGVDLSQCPNCKTGKLRSIGWHPINGGSVA